MRWLDRHKVGVLRRLEERARAAGCEYAPRSIADFEAEWAARWPLALAANPVEPRLTTPWQLLDTIEMWARRRGWYRSGFGPNGHQNGFNVFFKQLPRDHDGDDTSWATDEPDGQLDKE